MYTEITLFKDPLFWKALSNTLLIGIIAHIPILLGGLALAYILNSKLVKGENIFKTIYFMPMVTSSVAISIIFQTMFGNNYGVINWFLSLFGGKNINWLGGDGSLIKVAVIVMFAWKWVGWNMVIYLAGMQGISNDIYEAARIDGASNTRVMFSIVIPLLKPIIIFTVVQSSIGMFNLFTEPFILTNSSWTGGVNNGGLTLMMYLLNKAPQGGNSYGYASACAYVITIMIVVISIFVNKFSEEKETSHFMKKLADDLSKEIKQLEKKPVDKLLDDRYEKYRKIGRYSEYSEAVGEVPGAAQLLGVSQAPARKRRGLFGRG